MFRSRRSLLLETSSTETTYSMFLYVDVAYVHYILRWLLLILRWYMQILQLYLAAIIISKHHAVISPWLLPKIFRAAHCGEHLRKLLVLLYLTNFPPQFVETSVHRYNASLPSLPICNSSSLISSIRRCRLGGLVNFWNHIRLQGRYQFFKLPCIYKGWGALTGYQDQQKKILILSGRTDRFAENSLTYKPMNVLDKSTMQSITRLLLFVVRGVDLELARAGKNYLGLRARSACENSTPPWAIFPA